MGQFRLVYFVSPVLISRHLTHNNSPSVREQVHNLSAMFALFWLWRWEKGAQTQAFVFLASPPPGPVCEDIGWAGAGRLRFPEAWTQRSVRLRDKAGDSWESDKEPKKKKKTEQKQLLELPIAHSKVAGSKVNTQNSAFFYRLAMKHWLQN